MPLRFPNPLGTPDWSHEDECHCACLGGDRRLESNICVHLEKVNSGTVQVGASSLVYFLYGLAFFSMGLAILIEIGRATDPKLRLAMRPLAAFGLLQAGHEWIAMFQGMGQLPAEGPLGLLLRSVRLGLLAYSFLSLTAVGAALIARNEVQVRLSLLVPLVLALIWGSGLLSMRSFYSPGPDVLRVAEAWSRYVLGVPSALIAASGFIAQQRDFRRAGLLRFGRDCLWAAIAFTWYGVVGQLFPVESALPPSTVLNQDRFLELVGVPIQVVRMAAATLAAFFVIRFLRAFEVELRSQLDALRASRLEEAERREAMRGQLLRRIVEAQESERKRIARELHDATGQGLTALGLGLRGVARSLEVEPSKAARNLRQLESLVDRALDDLQGMIADLRPSHLDDLGLGPALRWLVGEIKERSGLQLRLTIMGESRDLEPHITTAIFRIAQEALNNVVKHAQAMQVSVRLLYAEDHVRLTVADDGIGFKNDASGSNGRPSWGLVGMEERASLLGGQLQIRSTPGSGTVVEVRLPYALEESQAYDDALIAD